eukprot:7227535-Prymnesium_polylepis.1
MTLASLARGHEEHQAAIAAAGAIKGLVKMLGHERQDEQLAAAAAICAVCAANSDNCKKGAGPPPLPPPLLLLPRRQPDAPARVTPRGGSGGEHRSETRRHPL